MTDIGYKGGIAIGEIIVYVPALAIAILLTIRHGFGRNSGWIFLIIFTLIRILGACFQLALDNDSNNQSIQTGAAILSTVGLSPLELCALGLLSRVISSINKSSSTFISPRLMKFAQLIVTVAFILAIIGGIDSSTQYTKDIQSQQQNPSKAAIDVQLVPQPLSKAAMGLFIAAYVILLVSTIMISFSLPHAEPGEKRLLLAVALSLPSILVRLIYSSISLFGNSADFRNNVTILLCMAFLMELSAVIIFEAIGLTLRKITPVEMEPHGENANGIPGSKPSKWSQFVRTLQRRTIIGRLITGLMGSRDDVEMHGLQGGRRARRAARREVREQGYKNVASM
jgi:hypothetical protein